MAGFFVTPGRVVVYGAALTSMENNPGGPVGTLMDNRALRVENLARALCPVETPESARRHHRAAGRLKASIYRRRMIRPGSGVSFEVGSNLIYARRIEFNRKVGGFLRGALTASGGTLMGGQI